MRVFNNKNNTITMEKKAAVITECLKCKARYKNYFNVSPCCQSIVLKVDENGNSTTITFLSALSKPRPHIIKKIITE